MQKKTLSIFFSLFIIPLSVVAQQVVVNEYINELGLSSEWVELLVVQDVDLRDWQIRDFTSSGASGNTLIFSESALWSSVPAGTLIQVAGSSVFDEDDSDGSDFVLKIRTTNTTFFSGNGVSIVSSSDGVQVLNAAGEHVHGLSHGTANANSLPEPSAHLEGDLPSGNALGFSSTEMLSDFSDASKLQLFSEPSPALGNDPNNTAFIESLRVIPEEPTLLLQVEGNPVFPSNQLSFPFRFVGETAELSFVLKNIGQQALEINAISSSASQITSSFASQIILAQDEESQGLVFTFTPTETDTIQTTIRITSNDANNPTFSFTLLGPSYKEGDPIELARARNFPKGTRVGVRGIVTVSDELGGPVYLEDSTAGLAVFDNNVISSVTIGDSILVTGPLTEFGNSNGVDGDGLLQISGSGVSFEVLASRLRDPVPGLFSVAELGEQVEGRLVELRDVTITGNGNFAGNTNYSISDNSGSSEMRIDGDTDLVGRPIPFGKITLIGVVSEFRGTRQILPRFASDVGEGQVIEIPFEEISKDVTLEIATWNIEWFGSTTNGPSNEALQLQNVVTVIEAIDADIYAFQEISSATAFSQLDAALSQYSGRIAGFDQIQRTAFLFKDSVIEELNSTLIEFSNDFPFAGRLPLMANLEATIDGKTIPLSVINIHAKANDDVESYNRRVTASNTLKAFLDENMAEANIVFLGDYNDDVDFSIAQNRLSPYANFVEDSQNYRVISKALSDQGASSFIPISSMIDHITISNELFDDYLDGTVRLAEVDGLVSNFVNTTSDHLPVWARFDIQTNSNVETQRKPDAIFIAKNYPNPFNPSTRIQFTLPLSNRVSIRVYDMMGRLVRTIVEDRSFAQGQNEVVFDAQNLSSGLYMYLISTLSGESISGKMMLVK